MLVVTFLPIDSTPLMTRLIVKPTKPTITKRKRGQPANYASKQSKNWVLNTCNIWTIQLL